LNKRIFILITTLLLLVCFTNCKQSKSVKPEHWKESLFVTIFNDNDVNSIEFVEIEQSNGRWNYKSKKTNK